MQSEFRLFAKIARAISDFSDAAWIDEQKCRRIALLIDDSDERDRIESMVEQYAGRIESMRAEDFVQLLHDAAVFVDERREDVGEPRLGRSRSW